MENTKEIYLWLNGKKPDSIYSFLFNPNNNPTLLSFKERISKLLKKDNIKIHHDNMCLFTQKGIEFDESDMQYIYTHQILFIIKNDEEFHSSNHYYQYEFIKWIKSGGYGQVFLAQHIMTKEEFGIKQIDTKSFSSQDLYNISREHVILQSFKHKNIIKCHHYYAYEDHFFTVMDSAKGGELGRYVRDKGGLKEKEAKKIFKQIYNAVNYIHGKNMIHRDLKPNNILFLNKEQTEIVLIDFGISGFSNGNIKEKIYAGTIRFQPPEMASGTSFTSTPKIDVWALGVILYYMIYNSFPFDGKNDKEVNKAIVFENVHFNPKIKISEECRDLIRNMLQKNSKLRIGMDSESFDKWFNKKDYQYSKNTYSLSNKTMKNNKIINRQMLFPIKNDIRKYIDEFLQVNSFINNQNKSSSSSNLFNDLKKRSRRKISNISSMINLNVNIKLPLLPGNEKKVTLSNDENENINDYANQNIFNKKEKSQTSPYKIRRAYSYRSSIKSSKLLNSTNTNSISNFTANIY